jgi:hypothetical protein
MKLRHSTMPGIDSTKSESIFTRVLDDGFRQSKVKPFTHGSDERTDSFSDVRPPRTQHHSRSSYSRLASLGP